MATLDFPAVIPSSVSFGIRYNTQVNVSSLSGSAQSIELPGARWVSTMSFDGLEPSEARLLAAFLAKLRGASGRFKLYDFSHPTPTFDPVVIAPLGVGVNGAGQVGASLNTAGWTPTTGELLMSEGDYIQLEGNEVKMLTADVVSNGTSLQTLSFEPPIRTSPSDLSVVGLSHCTAVMMLIDDENRWDTDNPGLLSNFNINCAEAF